MDNQKVITNSRSASGRKYYPRAFSNLLHMGHCAPTVMQSIQDITVKPSERLMRLSAGMPGGIGNTGHECGGITSPLVVLGTRFGLRETDGGLPEIVARGHSLCQNFIGCHRTMECKLIRGNDHFPKHCIPPVLRAPGMFMEAQNGHYLNPLPIEARASYTRLYAHFKENQFHCAREVFTDLGYNPNKDQELFEAASAFMGGTLFMGRTCSAFTAGVMAIGLKIGEIEDSPLRVIRLLAIMTVGGNAFNDKLNKFNASMNRGYKLSKWFAKEFGSTQCGVITSCDFSTIAGVGDYINADQVTRCKEISKKVARQVEHLLA
jgi:C_GCAxxG_C_C family probable redox protein